MSNENILTELINQHEIRLKGEMGSELPPWAVQMIKKDLHIKELISNNQMFQAKESGEIVDAKEETFWILFHHDGQIQYFIDRPYLFGGITAKRSFELEKFYE